MKKEKVIHAYIDCQICNKIITQYLGEEPAFEVIKIGDGPVMDVCIACADEQYNKKINE